MISLVRLAKSFKYAINGVRITLREEQNFRVHMVSGVLVALIGWALHIEALEWVALVIVSGLVLLAEMVNTIFERIVDVLKPRIHPFAEVVKDMMAATVVLAVFVAVIVGLIIFVPYLVDFVQSFS